MHFTSHETDLLIRLVRYFPWLKTSALAAYFGSTEAEVELILLGAMPPLRRTKRRSRKAITPHQQAIIKELLAMEEPLREMSLTDLKTLRGGITLFDLF